MSSRPDLRHARTFPSTPALAHSLLTSTNRCHGPEANMLIRVCSFRCEILPPRGRAKSILGSNINIFPTRSIRNSSPPSCHPRTSPIAVVNATLKTPFIENGTFFMTNALARNTTCKYSSPAERALLFNSKPLRESCGIWFS